MAYVPRWSASAFLLALGCGSAPDPAEDPAVSTPEPESSGPVFPGGVVGSSWPGRMATDATRAPFEQQGGWAALVMQRDYPAAMAAFSGEPPLPLGQARVHLELAAAYRQALLLGAHATVQVHGENRRDEDPPHVDCLLAVSYVLLADGERAQAARPGCEASGDADLVEHAVAWLDWHQGGAVWPPASALAATPGQPGDAVVGALPDAGQLPHWTTKDLVEGLEIQLASPAGLLGLALYHEDAALTALGDAASAGQAFLTPWRIPAEPAGTPEVEVELPAELLFGSTLLLSADAWFLADLARGQGLAAIDAWKDRSLQAAAVAPCVDTTAGKVDVTCALEAATGGFDQLRTAQEIISGGEQGFHRPFAELGRLGVVRAAELAAAVAGDEEAMGLLRLNALDFSIGSSAEPHYLLSIAAWDAGNRNSSRATESLHAQVGHIPGAEVARYPLDALHVRMSRESAPGVPMH